MTKFLNRSVLSVQVVTFIVKISLLVFSFIPTESTWSPELKLGLVFCIPLTKPVLYVIFYFNISQYNEDWLGVVQKYQGS